MNTGTVKFFIEEKGYGFVIDKVTGKEYFFHTTNVKGHAVKGDVVYYTIKEGKRGLIAVDVQPI